MPFVNFALFDYVPVLATAEVERIAYEHLRPQTLEEILPVFELSRHRGATDFASSIQLVQNFVERHFILDLDKRVAPPPYEAVNPANPGAEAARVARETEENNQFNAHLNGLLSPANGFENWRAIVGQFPNAVPVLQYTNPAAQANAIIRQASLLSEGGNCIALRLVQSHSEIVCQIAVQILALLRSSAQLLLIFDCGQGRRGSSEKAAWVQTCIQEITSQIELEQQANLNAVCMSNSYPQPSHEGVRVVENYDREIWEEASEVFPFAFGDYAASYRASALSSFMPRNYRATVVHSLDRQWVIHRHENADDPNGWFVGCQVIVDLEGFDPIDSWTDDTIQDVAAHGLGDMGVSRLWHAARIAGHIERQHGYQPQIDEE